MKHYAMVMESSFTEAAFPSDLAEIEPPKSPNPPSQKSLPNKNKGETNSSDRTLGPEQIISIGGSAGGSIQGQKRAKTGKIGIEPRGSIPDAIDESERSNYKEKLLVLLGSPCSSQEFMGVGEWARRD